jgi:hypothetical protein
MAVRVYSFAVLVNLAWVLVIFVIYLYSEYLFHSGAEVCVRLRVICISSMSYDGTLAAISQPIILVW